MSIVLGIDPGANTGAALYIDGTLSRLVTISPDKLARYLASLMPDRVVFEDSRLSSFMWSQVKSRAAALKMARNVGEIDAWCKLIAAICAELNIPARGISPKGKGAKLSAERFALATGWTASSNEHTRDAAMVAFPYRKAQA